MADCVVILHYKLLYEALGGNVAVKVVFTSILARRRCV
jgi:hypothetical protein